MLNEVWMRFCAYTHGCLYVVHVFWNEGFSLPFPCKSVRCLECDVNALSDGKTI